jgi:transposase
MGRIAYLDIKESLTDLKELLSKQRNLKGEKRVTSLLLIKTKKFTTLQEVSNYLGIHIRTLERWIGNYKSVGIHDMLSDKPKNKQSKIITPKTHTGLSQRVNDPQNPFLGYWDAQQWISTTYGVDVKYQRVKAIEIRIEELIFDDVSMQKNYELLSSLKGVGFVVACQLIYHTGNFTRFDNWRSFSSYCGTAPFAHESGTSIKRRKQCHYLGDRKMKSLLSMASISAIQHDSELRIYYKRKLAEGKDKMLAINNVRNKLIASAFAVVKRGTPYVVLQNYAA